MTDNKIFFISAVALVLSASAAAAQTSRVTTDSGIAAAGRTQGTMVPEERSPNSPRPYAPSSATGTAQPADQPRRSGVNGP